MPKPIKRHFLREKERDKVLRELSHKLNVEVEQLLGSKLRIELAETRFAQIYILNGKPILARLKNTISPTMAFKKIFPLLPKIIVDMGAVAHLCDGADVMAPGLIRIDGNFSEDDILLIVDEQHEKPFAIGIALFDSQEMRNRKHGKVVKNIHHVGDRIWNLLKEV